jgi:hypothetical protein
VIKPRNLPRDTAQRAKAIVDLATGEAEVAAPNPATEAQRRGGEKGGRGRAKVIPKVRRAEIAAIAAQARWKKRG